MESNGLFLCLRIPKSGSQSLTRGLEAAFAGRHIFYVPNTLDPDSRVSRLSRVARGYHVLEELNTRPAITYLRRVIPGAPDDAG